MIDSLTQRLLTLIVALGFFAVLGALIWRGLPAEGGDALLVLLGALGGAFGTVVGYHFGSSSGSAEKTRLLAHATPSVEPNVGEATDGEQK